MPVKNIWNVFKSVIWMLALVFIVSCGKKQEQKIPVAKFNDKYLYLSDIQHIFPKGVSKEDSISLARAYITTWVKTQLLVNKAEINLPKDQLNVDEQLEAYRSSLLIFKYEEQMIKDKLDTTVSDDEMEQYFNQNASSLILDDNVVKALFIKVPKNAPDIDNLKKWYKSDQREEIKKLDSYCFNYAVKFDYFKDEWVNFDVINSELPKPIANEDEYLSNNRTIEQSDSSFLYFVYLKEKVSKGSVSPLDFIKPKIKDIIVNKRKIKFLDDLETKIYHDAEDHDNFTIYNLEKKSK
ncbi:MAG TPA: hypothetical protein VIH57_05505 [Bacteroidales bacterium]